MRPSRVRIVLEAVTLLLPLLHVAFSQVGALATGNSWLTGGDLEREREAASFGEQSSSSVLRSPAFIGQQLNGRSSYLFSRNNGRFLLPVEELRQINLFQCVEPTRSLYGNFARQYSRRFKDNEEELERLQLFAVTLKRAIVLNRVIQNEIMNSSNQATRNYHFIEPLDNQNLALWYSDITDCELALIKNVLLDAFHSIDENKPHVALNIVQNQKEYLPGLLNADGFEQMANILLVRLYDRFRGDDKMNQLFEWPMYLKRLASVAYSQQQAQQPDYKTKLSMVAFAYPAYFKDLKYNHPAINRTNDNLKANQAHKQFNEATGRKLANLKVANRRLSIFRQRWSLVNQLNADQFAEANETSRQLDPDWLRVKYLTSGGNNDDFAEETAQNSGAANQRSDRLRLAEPYTNQLDQQQANRAYKLTQFSDLSDIEFQAFLSNDFSLLCGNKESAEYLDANFPVRPLSERYRWELAHELEMRHGMLISGDSLELLRKSGDLAPINQRLPSVTGQPQSLRPSLRLAKQVVDELISDVGLPIGPAALEDITEDEQVRMFERVATFFQKPYLHEARPGQFNSQLTNVDLLDERRLRLEQFKENYGRFKAWFIKEGWSLNEAQTVAMLRLADMSWLEIKLSMFKLCCLTGENLIALSSTNATIQYLGSNYELLCDMDEPTATATTTANAKQQQQQSNGELSALEIYYYYTVHFNKHHNNKEEFERRFSIFRNNTDSIRRLSCKRSLTLFESLKNKRSDLLNTIDVLDARRSHTDDLNLDRFEYFRLETPNPRLSRERDLVPVTPWLGSSQAQLARQTQSQSPSSGFDSSRAGFSYRRNSHFGHLLDRANTTPPLENWPSSTSYQTLGQSSDSSHIYANRLVESLESVNEATNKYTQNRVARIYDLVLERYVWCRDKIDNVQLRVEDLRQSCQANGLLGDHAAQLGGNLWADDVNGGGGVGNLADQQRQFGRQQDKDRCAFYRRGLDPWAEGLIKQEPFSAQLIQSAKC